MMVKSKANLYAMVINYQMQSKNYLYTHVIATDIEKLWLVF